MAEWFFFGAKVPRLFTKGGPYFSSWFRVDIIMAHSNVSGSGPHSHWIALASLKKAGGHQAFLYNKILLAFTNCLHLTFILSILYFCSDLSFSLSVGIRVLELDVSGVLIRGK